MNDRLLTLATAIGALLVTVFLLLPPPTSKQAEKSLPSSEDRGNNGLKGLNQWLQYNRIPTFSLRKRYNDLYREDMLADQGNLLVMSLPVKRELLDSEWPALASWISQGNSVLILGAVYQDADWAPSEACFCDAKKLLAYFDWDISSEDTGISSADDKADLETGNVDKSLKNTLDSIRADVEAYFPISTNLLPLSKHPLLDKVRSVETFVTPALLNEKWYLYSETDSPAFRLLSPDVEKNITSLWQIPADDGQIFLSLTADLFSNKQLNQADNAKLISNLINHSVSGNGRIIFDDYHFGLSDFYDAERFFHDTRLYKSIAGIGFLWLLYVFAYTNRLAPVREAIVKPSVVQFVSAMAGYFARKLDKPTLAQELLKSLLYDIRQLKGLQNDASGWQWLQQHPQVQTEQIALLEQAQQGQCKQLQRLSNTIISIRKTIHL